MPSEPCNKFCKDCRWSAGPMDFLRCEAPQNFKQKNLVNGEDEYATKYCATHRDVLNQEHATICTPAAKWFEAKPAVETSTQPETKKSDAN